MEYRVLDGYLDFKNKRKPGFKEFFHRLSFGNKAGFAGMVIAVIILFLPAWKREFNIEMSVFGIVLELVCVFYLQKSQQRQLQKNSIEGIKNMDKRYEDLLGWLQSIEYGEKNKIRQLCYRCEVLLVKIEEKEKRRQGELFKIIVAPTYLALISWVLTLEGSIEERLTIVIEFLFAITGVYILGKEIRNSTMSIWDNTQENFKDLIDDLHGVLDRCFPIEENDIGK